MDLIQNWPYKWFGMWKDQRDGFKNYPDIEDFIQPQTVAKYQHEKLYNYLKNSQILLATSGDYAPDPFTGEIIEMSICHMTDGIWVWINSLPYYIDKYKVAIPEAFLENIERNNFMPVKWDGDMDALDWPDPYCL